MMSNSQIWGCCSEGGQNEEFVICNTCLRAFHLDCVSLPVENNVVGMVWYCPSCLPKTKKNDNTLAHPQQGSYVTIRPPKRQAFNSPEQTRESILKREEVKKVVRNIMETEFHSKGSEAITRTDVKDIVQEVIKTEMRGLLAVLSSNITSELKTIKEDIFDVKQSMDFINCQYEDFMNETKANKEVINNLQKENLNLKETIEQLNGRVNQLEQHARSNNIELQCVPEKNSENLIAIVTQIGEAIGYEISEDKILHCTRIAKMNRESTRPRSIIIQLSSPRIRDNYLAAAINFNKTKKDPTEKLNTTHIGFRERTPIFVTEHLSPTNKTLHAAVRQKAKAKGYKYVWIRGGRIYARKGDNEEFIHIKNFSCLDKLV